MSSRSKGKIKTFFFRLFLVLLVLGVLCGGVLGLLNYFVIESSRPTVYSLDAFESSDASRAHYDAVIVLGCAVWDNGPSPMLADRLRTAAAVYKTGCADYVLVSGDSEHPDDYDETKVQMLLKLVIPRVNNCMLDSSNNPTGYLFSLILITVSGVVNPLFNKYK